MLTYPHFSDFRRYVQLAILASSLVWLCWFVLFIIPSPRRSLKEFLKGYVPVLAVSFLLLVVYIIILGGWRAAGLRDWLEVLVMSGIISSLWVAIFEKREASEPAQEVPVTASSLTPIFMLGIYAALSAWWFGPAPLEALVNFQGSTIFVASGACMGFFCMLFVNPKWKTWLLALPFLFIVVISTARSAVPIVVYFSIALALRISLGNGGNWFGRSLRFAAVFAMPIVLYVALIFSTFVGDRYYPYQASRMSGEEILYRNGEFFCRYTRILRLVNFGDFSIMDLLPGTAESYEKAVADFVGKRGLVGLSDSLSGKDERYELWYQTYEAIISQAQGYWPTRFTEKVAVKCDKLNLCGYPHNLILDGTFKFGWLLGAVLFMLVAAATLKLTWILVKSKDLISMSFAIVVLTHFMVSQISGTFVELANLPVLLLLFTFYRTHAKPIVAKELRP